jgi:hypothetical protein
MTTLEHPWREPRCTTGKLTFHTADEARLYAARASIPLASYHCPSCRHWHLTHDTPQED